MSTEDESGNPWDSSPKSEAEAVESEVLHADLRAFLEKLRFSRVSLEVEWLAELRDPGVYLEAAMPNRGLFLFSVCGTLRGHSVRQALVDGAAMIVSAAGPAEAHRVAQRNLEQSLDLARALVQGRPEVASPASGVSTEGRVRGKEEDGAVGALELTKILH